MVDESTVGGRTYVEVVYVITHASTGAAADS